MLFHIKKNAILNAYLSDNHLDMSFLLLKRERETSSRLTTREIYSFFIYKTTIPPGLKIALGGLSCVLIKRLN